MTTERIQIGLGKAPFYRLIVDGADLGTVKRMTETQPGGRRDTFWLAANRGHVSREKAEEALHERARKAAR